MLQNALRLARSFASTLALVLLGGAGAAGAADGDLDTTFRGDGTYLASPATASGAQAIAFDAASRVILGVTRDFGGTDDALMLLRVPDEAVAVSCGVVDPDLGGTDTDRLASIATARGSSAGTTIWVAGQADGPPADPEPQLLVAAIKSAPCTTDPAFGEAGGYDLENSGVNLTSRDLIWVPEFGGALRLLYSVAPQAEHTVRIRGYIPASGEFDPDWVNGAIVLSPIVDHDDFEPGGLARAADGRIYAVGTIVLDNGDRDVLVARFLSNGTPDTSWSGDGVLWFSFDIVDNGPETATSAAMTPDGRLVVVGSVERDPGSLAAVAVLDPDGTFDLTFGNLGRYVFDFANSGGNNRIHDVAVQGDGKIVVAGYAGSDALFPNTDFAIARLASTGGAPLDSSFHGDGIRKIAFDLGGFDADAARAVAIDGGGRIVVAGSAIDDTEARVAAVRLQNSYIFADGFESGASAEWTPSISGTS